MKTLSPVRTASREQEAFTKTELLVVVAIFALLTCLRLSAAGGAMNRTKITQCAANLRQLGLTLLMYGSDNAGRLPPSGGSWAWDLEWNAGNQLNQYGIPPERMYCPGTAPRFTPADNAQLYAFSTSFHVIGYTTTLSTESLVASNVNTTLTPQPVNGAVGLASRRVLAADATISQTSSRTAGNFTEIHGGFRLAHLTPHLEGNLPAGGNAVMLDGHVEWRDFSQLQVRTKSGPYFWW
jgi:prepilin-type processing-associated H-X9-DG protein